MAQLKNHSRFTLRDDAATAFNHAEDEHGVFKVNSAARTIAQQNKLIARWNLGGRPNRPPFLYAPARPAESSNHVKDGGIAVDLSDWRRFATIAARYGFSHPYPGGDPVHFEFVGVASAEQSAGGAFNQDVLNRQRYLNQNRAAGLVEDGRNGPRTKAAVRLYQSYLKSRGFYSGVNDGIWGPVTQSAHLKNVQPAPQPALPPQRPSGRIGSVNDLPTIGDTRGLQKVAKLHGYTGRIDNVFGSGSKRGLQNFLNKSHGGSLATWLRRRWGYSDADNIWGPNMAAAAVRANAANFKAL